MNISHQYDTNSLALQQGCYRKEMNAKDKEFYDIVLNNCTEKEIYAILLKKKEIDDITPKLRTGDENKMLKCLVNKMRKYSKDLIADIKKKCPSLQRKPKTAEQRKEQDKEGHSQKRSVFTFLSLVCCLYVTFLRPLERAPKVLAPSLFTL